MLGELSFTDQSIGFSQIAYGNDQVTGTMVAVPEPAPWMLMLTGVLGLGMVARRREQMSA